MIKFIFNLFWKLFSLFFVIHIISHWTELTQLFSECTDSENSCPDDTFSRIIDFSKNAFIYSFTSVLSCVKVLIFVGEKGVGYIKSKTMYDQFKLDFF